jgi:hypothetical protein
VEPAAIADGAARGAVGPFGARHRDARDRPAVPERDDRRPPLADVRAVFDSRATDAEFRKGSVEGRCELEEAGWDNYYGRKLAPTNLGRLLRRSEIRSRTGRVGEDTANDQFADAWRRYVAAPTLAGSGRGQAAAGHAT